MTTAPDQGLIHVKLRTMYNADDIMTVDNYLVCIVRVVERERPVQIHYETANSAWINLMSIEFYQFLDLIEESTMELCVQQN